MQEKILRLQTKQKGNDKLFCTARYLLFVDYIFLKKTKLKPSFRTKIVKNHSNHKQKINPQNETMRKTLIPFSSTISQWEKQQQHKTIQNTYCSTQMYDTHTNSHTNPRAKKLLKRRIWMYFINVFCLYTWKRYDTKKKKKLHKHTQC